jgi:hypothetical protein
LRTVAVGDGDHAVRGIHGELLKLGVDVSGPPSEGSTAARPPRLGAPSCTDRHGFFIVATATFQVLYARILLDLVGRWLRDRCIDARVTIPPVCLYRANTGGRKRIGSILRCCLSWLVAR